MALPLLAVRFLLLPIKPQSKQKYEEKPRPIAAVWWLKLKVTA